MATNVRSGDAPPSSTASGWRRARQVLLAAVFVMLSVAAQAIDKTPLAIVLLVLAIVSLAPLALPAIDQQ